MENGGWFLRLGASMHCLIVPVACLVCICVRAGRFSLSKGVKMCVVFVPRAPRVPSGAWVFPLMERVRRALWGPTVPAGPFFSVRFACGLVKRLPLACPSADVALFPVFFLALAVVPTGDHQVVIPPLCNSINMFLRFVTFAAVPLCCGHGWWSSCHPFQPCFVWLCVLVPVADAPSGHSPLLRNPRDMLPQFETCAPVALRDAMDGSVSRRVPSEGCLC